MPFACVHFACVPRRLFACLAQALSRKYGTLVNEEDMADDEIAILNGAAMTWLRSLSTPMCKRATEVR